VKELLQSFWFAVGLTVMGVVVTVIRHPNFNFGSPPENYYFVWLLIAWVPFSFGIGLLIAFWAKRSKGPKHRAWSRPMR